MRTITQTATVIFLAGVLCARQAAAHGKDHTAEAQGEQPETAAAAGTKGTETKTNKLKEKTTRAALQKYNCLLCHKYKGKGGTTDVALDEHLKHHPKAELKKLLQEPKKPMPPFPGTEKELDKFLTTVIPAATGSETGARPAVKKVSKTYVCPMGDYEGDKPGKCPKCGMTLVEKK